MKCLQHPTADAVGVCRNCQRGLCTDCVTLVGVSVACKGRCEQAVGQIASMVDRAASRVPARLNGETYLALANWLFVGALLFLGVLWMTSEGRPSLVAYAGPLFFVIGGFMCRSIAGKWRDRA